MVNKLNNQDRFDILRGYYQRGKFNSPVGHTDGSLNAILHKLNFEKLDDFLVWYKSLTPEEIKDAKKDWCPGDCCQSLLLRLLN
jgi:hypothetical protein